MRQPSIACSARLVQHVYRQRPGLSLTPEQARRRWNLDETVCRAILEVLVDLQFLRRTGTGSYVRRDLA